jgi:hypothetical protein
MLLTILSIIGLVLLLALVIAAAMHWSGQGGFFACWMTWSLMDDAFHIIGMIFALIVSLFNQDS